jgi:glycosyltransferase involved in cell wall biosynthesis
VTRVVVLSQDRVGERMGGNAIRATELARALRTHAEVTLAAPGEPPGGVDHVAFDLGAPQRSRALLAAADAIVTVPQSPTVTAELRASGARLVYDLYDPAPLEMLEAFSRDSRARKLFWSTLALDYTLEALHAGHHFVCASERQRDLWLGAMLGARLIGPAAYARDPSFREVIDVVPFGVPARPPQPGPGPRERFPALGDDAEIVLWNGGLWNWLDPVTAVRAVGRLAARRPRARLVFMGTAPAAGGEEARAAEAARELAAREGLLERVVFFNDAWVPYDERDGWLLQADCALSTHVEHLETRFSFRTRLLDCFWAGLPVVCTAGDELADSVAREDLGAAVAPADPEAVAAGLERVLDRGRDAYAPALARAAADHAWERVAAPLARYVTATTPPVALGAPWARRAARPVQRARATATRLGRRLQSGPWRP